MNLHVSSFSHVGGRESNEDTVLADGPVYAVCDGMGGHEAGEVASALCASTLEGSYAALTSVRTTPKKALELAMHAANTVVYNESNGNGMGTTCTAIAFANNGKKAFLAHVGDSRAYLCRAGEAPRQVTRDHRVQIDGRTFLSEVVGRTDTHIDYKELAIDPGDSIFLCSDGVWEVADIAELVANDSSLENALETVLSRNPQDNVSGILIRVA